MRRLTDGTWRAGTGTRRLKDGTTSAALLARLVNAMGPSGADDFRNAKPAPRLQEPAVNPGSRLMSSGRAKPWEVHLFERRPMAKLLDTLPGRDDD
jgi:hypothetical protein